MFKSTAKVWNNTFLSDGPSFNPFTIQYQVTNSPFLLPYISYRSSGEKLLKYLTWVTTFWILITSLTDKPLILQWEIWLR